MFHFLSQFYSSEIIKTPPVGSQHLIKLLVIIQFLLFVFFFYEFFKRHPPVFAWRRSRSTIAAENPLCELFLVIWFDTLVDVRMIDSSSAAELISWIVSFCPSSIFAAALFFRQQLLANSRSTTMLPS